MKFVWSEKFCVELCAEPVLVPFGSSLEQTFTAGKQASTGLSSAQCQVRLKVSAPSERPTAFAPLATGNSRSNDNRYHAISGKRQEVSLAESGCQKVQFPSHDLALFCSELARKFSARNT